MKNLISAIEQNDINIVIQTLANIIDINEKNDSGKTPLMISVKNGYKDISALLLDRGADVNIIKNGLTALILAITHGNIEIVTLLIAHGADVNAKTIDRSTALMYAASNGRTDIVSVLIQEGADINAIGEYGKNALILAARNRQKETVKLLLDHGAHIGMKNMSIMFSLIAIETLSGERSDTISLILNQSLIFSASKNEKETTFTLLDKYADINAVDKDDMSSLMFAAQNGHVDMTSMLLNKGADFNAKNKDNMTALMLASQNGYTKTATLLLNWGADFNTENKDNMTALMLATQNGHIKIVDLLFDKGPSIHAKKMTNWLCFSIFTNLYNIKKITPLIDAKSKSNTTLMIAIQNRHTEIVKMIINRMHDNNAKNNIKNTALMIAVRYGNTEIVKLLLDQGADFNTKNNNGENALMIAAICNHRKILNLMLCQVNNIDDYESELITTMQKTYWWTNQHTAVIDNNLDQIQRYEYEKSQINPLDIAIMFGNIEAVRSITARNIEYDINDCIHTSILTNRSDITIFFLENASDTVDKNQLLQTASHIARSHGNKDIMSSIGEVMRKKNSDKYIQKTYHSPLFYIKKPTTCISCVNVDITTPRL